MSCIHRFLLALALVLTGLLACNTTLQSLEGRPCPCATEYTCCEATGLCQPNGSVCARADDPPDADQVDCPVSEGVVARTSSDPRTWISGGTDPEGYVMEPAPSHALLGRPGAHIASKLPTASVETFGAMIHEVSATRYRGKKVRFSAIVEGSVSGRGGLWMRVDGPTGPLAVDNMQDRALVGEVASKRIEVVLDVAETAVVVAYGVLISGAGELWLRDPALEIVTSPTRYEPDPAAWFPGGDGALDYLVATGVGDVCGQPEARIQSATDRPAGEGTLMQEIAASAYRGRRVKLSGLLAAETTGRAGLWMRVDDDAGRALAFDDMRERPVTKSDWQLEDVVLDVPLEAASIAYGLVLEGKGKARIGPVQLEVVDSDVPTTD